MHKFPTSGLPGGDSSLDGPDGSFSNDVFKATGIVPNGSSRGTPARGENLKMRKVAEQSWLQNGERLQIEEQNIGYLSPICKVIGKVFVTNYRLRFEGRDPHAKDRICQFEIPLGFISKVEKIGHSNVSRGENAYGIELTCKDMRNIRFTSPQANHSRRALFDVLQKNAFPLSNKLPLFATLYTAVYRKNGWDLYDPVKEFRRMGVPNEEWVFTKINERYEFADTYPSVLVVPAAAQKAGDDFIRKVGEFRSRRRIPVLSWISPDSSAAITRSSQPLVGMTSRRSAEDEKYLEMIVEANANSHQLPIFDARPSVNAKVNRAKGGGFEDSYPGCQLEFCDIQNIHVVRESLRKVKDACFSLRKVKDAVFPKIDHKNWHRLMDDAKWLNHIQTIIEASIRIVTEIHENKSSVLVHCSDGWDRTAQLTSLAMIQLDPYYRTINGFAVLIEKEWCSFGHKFSHRVGHGEDKHGDGERSPIFVQFIDCVWQLYNQFDQMFEFNVHFLITILDELYACRFGTFLYNSEKQRFHDNNAKQNTLSLWSHIDENRQEFLNANYLSNPQSIDLIRPSRNILRMMLWTQYFARHNPTVISQERQVGLCAEDVFPPLSDDHEYVGGPYNKSHRRHKHKHKNGGQPSPSAYFYQDHSSSAAVTPSPPQVARRHSYNSAVRSPARLVESEIPSASLRRPVRMAPPPPPKPKASEVNKSTDKYANEYLLMKRDMVKQLVQRQENNVHRFQQHTDV